MKGACQRRLLVFTKPAREGRVKTRLIGDLSARQAADLHAAFLADLLPRLARGRFELRLAWALEDGEPLPGAAVPGVRQEGEDLGERLLNALAAAARDGAAVAAIGCDCPALTLATVEDAFARVEAGAPVVLGPARDGGYYLIALAPTAVRRELFSGIPWSTAGVLGATLERCRDLGLPVALLAEAADVDTPDDLSGLADALRDSDLDCPRTRALLASWSRVPQGVTVAGACES